jgi:hypothetical protein
VLAELVVVASGQSKSKGWQQDGFCKEGFLFYGLSRYWRD